MSDNIKPGQQGTRLASAALLQRIDKLFDCGASQYVELPQIVVVGDQSSGKSSVLSSLIGRDLPRDASLCTRYPTKIIFRRTKESSVRISIIPDPKATIERQKYIKGLKSWKSPSFEHLDIERVIREVNDHILDQTGHETDASKTSPAFSRDVLQIEIAGPDKDNLSVIDIPGIFRDPEPGKTTADDMKLVRSMVKGYMKSRRSVMLVVIPSNVDLATQEILTMANEVDPEGDRTLGILTKPDLVDVGTEERIMGLLAGHIRPLKLGWHIVRNPGQASLTSTGLDRRSLEHEFFTTNSRWNRLGPHLWGVKALEARIREVLGDVVERQFADVKIDVHQRLIKAQQDLKHLGPERNTRPAQAAFLTDISTEFQDLVYRSLAARFGGDTVFGKYPDLKIAPIVRDRMDMFMADMAKRGHTYELDPALSNDGTPESPGPIPRSTSYDGDEYDTSETLTPCTVRYEKDILGLADILDQGVIQQPLGTLDANSWLRDIYKKNRGFEIGTFDPVIVASAFQEQTTNWRSVSLGFASDVIVIVHRFVKTALMTVSNNKHVEAAVLRCIEDKLRERYGRAMDQVRFLLEVELNGVPMTSHREFDETLHASRHTRMSQLLSKLKVRHEQFGEAVLRAPVGNEGSITHDIGDIVRSYYEVARNRFIDNVLKQAVDYFLINGPNTPLKVFSPKLVSQMSEQELERIAGEEPKVKTQRDKLNKEITDLMKIEAILSPSWNANVDGA